MKVSLYPLIQKCDLLNIFSVPFHRPKLPRHRLNEKPPDCKKAYQLDFSLLTFPHLKTLRDRENVSRVLDEVETDAQLGVDVAAMLAANSSDWTAYNLAVHYWQLHSNASQAIECARRAVYFSPRFLIQIKLIMASSKNSCAYYPQRLYLRGIILINLDSSYVELS